MNTSQLISNTTIPNDNLFHTLRNLKPRMPRTALVSETKFTYDVPICLFYFLAEIKHWQHHWEWEGPESTSPKKYFLAHPQFAPKIISNVLNLSKFDNISSKITLFGHLTSVWDFFSNFSLIFKPNNIDSFLLSSQQNLILVPSPLLLPFPPPQEMDAGATTGNNAARTHRPQI